MVSIQTSQQLIHNLLLRVGNEYYYIASMVLVCLPPEYACLTDLGDEVAYAQAENFPLSQEGQNHTWTGFVLNDNAVQMAMSCWMHTSAKTIAYFRSDPDDVEKQLSISAEAGRTARLDKEQKLMIRHPWEMENYERKDITSRIQLTAKGKPIRQ